MGNQRDVEPPCLPLPCKSRIAIAIFKTAIELDDVASVSPSIPLLKVSPVTRPISAKKKKTLFLHNSKLATRANFGILHNGPVTGRVSGRKERRKPRDRSRRRTKSKEDDEARNDEEKHVPHLWCNIL